MNQGTVYTNYIRVVLNLSKSIIQVKIMTTMDLWKASQFHKTKDLDSQTRSSDTVMYGGSFISIAFTAASL